MKKKLRLAVFPQGSRKPASDEKTFLYTRFCNLFKIYK